MDAAQAEPAIDDGDGRVCGRCRRTFPRDPTLYETGTPGWWLCDECRAILITPPASSARRR